MTTITPIRASDADIEYDGYRYVWEPEVKLDLRTGRLRVTSDRADETGQTGDEYTGHVLCWSVRKAHGFTYNALLDDIEQHAQVLVDALTELWDGNNICAYTPGDDAQAAYDAIQELVDGIDEEAERSYLASAHEEEFDALIECAERLVNEYNPAGWAIELGWGTIEFIKDGVEYAEALGVYVDGGTPCHLSLAELEREFHESLKVALDAYAEEYEDAS